MIIANLFIKVTVRETERVVRSRAVNVPLSGCISAEMKRGKAGGCWTRSKDVSYHNMIRSEMRAVFRCAPSIY